MGDGNDSLYVCTADKTRPIMMAPPLQPGRVPPAWDAEGLRHVHEAPDKRDRVRAMFDAIAPTYERVNTLCSAGRDAAWRERAVRLARVGPVDRVLDVACGTGDLTRAFSRQRPRMLIGCDFAFEMLRLATLRGREMERYCLADGQRLPFADGSFDVVGCAFGVRNFQDPGRGLSEMARVLALGGRVVILEFTRPSIPLIRSVYEFYAGRIMPRIATWLSRDRMGAYRYLPESIRSFLTAGQMCGRLMDAGFVDVAAVPLSMGVVNIYTARRGA